MTERSRGAPDPTEPPCQDDAPTRSADLSALYRTDALFEALAARGRPGSPLPPAPGRRFPSGSDPVLGLLGALVADVDDGLPSASGARPRLHRTVETVTRHGADAVSAEAAVADGVGVVDGASLSAVLPDESDAVSLEPGEVAAGRSGSDGASRRDGDGDVPDQQQGSGSSRRGPRTIVALGVVGAVLATTGVAAAGVGLTEDQTATSQARTAERGHMPGQVKVGEDGPSSLKPKPPAGGRPGPTPQKRAHEEKHRAGRSGASRPGTSKRGMSDEERLRDRLDELLHSRPPRRPPARPDLAGQVRRRLDEIRRRVEHRIAQSRAGHPRS
ncbi:hypothetical protein [Actinomadura oligospora]|uniref:hypothetical protein n=1 Tax=Actinomadura oligospora TaxID=111804 RepID=UPI00047EBFE2|nr:hypothetical protein [Actinomadura oligospora]